MKASNFGEVGQMRRSSGISMNMMMKAHTLWHLLEAHHCSREVAGHVQANNAEWDDQRPGGVEDVGDS
jgi:hypothetical protein